MNGVICYFVYVFYLKKTVSSIDWETTTHHWKKHFYCLIIDRELSISHLALCFKCWLPNETEKGNGYKFPRINSHDNYVNIGVHFPPSSSKFTKYHYVKC